MFLVLVKLIDIFEFCHHEKRKTLEKWGDAIDSEKDFFAAEIFQTKMVESWNKIINKIPWKTWDKNEKMQLSVLTDIDKHMICKSIVLFF